MNPNKGELMLTLVFQVGVFVLTSACAWEVSQWASRLAATGRMGRLTISWWWFAPSCCRFWLPVRFAF